jgi:hypothetical protein
MSEHDDFVRFTAPRADEELHQGKPAPVTIGTSPEDGLPMQIAERNYDKAPPLTEDTLICMADKRSFVVRHADGSIRVSFEPAEVSRAPSGEYYVSREAFEAKVKPVEIESPGYGKVVVTRPNAPRILIGRSTVAVRVEPIRPQCQHYLRMQTDLSADREHRYFARSCMKQKTEEGEFYSVRDQLIGACSIREPRHVESESAILDAFDDNMIAQARSISEMEEFDVDRALAEEAKRGGLGVLGG